MRAAIYLRVSTRRQEKQGVSLDMQRELCEQRAKQDGYAQIEVFCEGGKSGTRADNRPKLQELLSRLPDFAAVYFYTISRLGRNKIETWQTLDRFSTAGVTVHSIKENIDLDSVSGRMLTGLQTVIAEAEAEEIRERTSDAIQSIIRSGRKWGYPPIGYRPGGVHKDETGTIIRRDPLQIDPGEADIVRELFQRYAEGEATFALVTWMNDTLPPRRAKHWSPTTIKNILTNPVCIGMMHTNGKTLPASHAAIIDEGLFRTVQQRLDENRNVPPSARARSLGPVFRCGLCGGPVGVYMSTKSYGSFGCTSRTMLPKQKRHEPAYAREEMAVAVVWKAVEYLLSDEAIADAQQRTSAARQASTKTRTLRREREKIEGKLVYNLEAAEAGAIRPDLLAKQNGPLYARLDEVNRLLAAEDEGQKRLEILRQVTAEEVLAMIQGADIEQQRRFLKRFFQRVEIHRGFLRFVPTVEGVPPFDAAMLKPSTKPEEIRLCLLTM